MKQMIKMSEAKKLRDKFNADLAKLQEECDHLESSWMPYMWAPGHFSGDVLVCSRCQKILEHEKPQIQTSEEIEAIK